MTWDAKFLGTIYAVEKKIYVWSNLHDVSDMTQCTTLQKNDVFVVVGNQKTSYEDFIILMTSMGIVYCSTFEIYRKCKSLCIFKK